MITSDQLCHLIEELAPPKSKETQKRTNNGKPDKELIRAMLQAIPGRPVHAEWTNYIAAVADALPDSEAIGLLQERWPEEQEGEYEVALKHRKQRVHIGTLIKKAIEHGWHWPESEKKTEIVSKRFELEDLMSFDARHDPNCLVGNRYLVRGGSSLWAAGSGYGKSTLALQLAVYWACGQTCFGLRPVRPLKSLLIQAENDLGDMGEQLQGVMTGIDALGDINVQASRELIEKNVLIYRAIGITGDMFLFELDMLLEANTPDLAWIDPMFAFAGCDLLNPKETSRFLRNGLFPIADRRRVAMNVIHHVGKPVRADTKTAPQIADIDLQYLGFGTSEIQNAFRVVNVLVPVSGDPTLFKLALSKRGERSGTGRAIYLRHSNDGMICWMQAEQPEKAPPKPRARKYEIETILDQMGNELWRTKPLLTLVMEETGMSEKTFYRLWEDCQKDQKVRVNSDREWSRT